MSTLLPAGLFVVVLIVLGQKLWIFSMPHPADDGCCHLPSIPSRNRCVMPCAQSNIFSSKALHVIVQIGRCASKRCILVSCAPPSPDTTTAAASVARPRGVDLHHNQGPTASAHVWYVAADFQQAHSPNHLLRGPGCRNLLEAKRQADAARGR